MKASRPNDENAFADPITSVLQTFCNLNGINMNTIVAASHKGGVSDVVLNSAIENHSDLILIPFEIGTNEFDTDSMALARLLQSPPCSVGIFLDRGFGMYKNTHDSDGDAESESLLSHKVYFPFFDDDDTDALSIVTYMVHNQNIQVEISCIMNEDIKKEDKLQKLQGLSNVHISYKSECNPESIEGENLKRVDLLILGMKHYHGSLKSWIDQGSSSSVLLVQKHARSKVINLYEI